MTRKFALTNLRILNKKFSDHIASTQLFLVFFASVFFVRSADSILSYAFPIVVENAVQSNTIMGLIISLSSVVGLVCDFVFPSLISRKNWKQMMMFSVLVAMLFPLSMFLGEVFAFVGFFLLASIVWGIYYELQVFSEQNYILHSDKNKNFSKDWSLLLLLIGMIAITGPIVASLLLFSGETGYPLFTGALYFSAFAILLVTTSRVESGEIKVKSKSKGVLKLLREFKTWKILYRKVWQVLVVSLTLQGFFASFAVFGGLFGLSLLGEEIGWLVMFLFAVPGLIAYVIFSKMLIKTRKKIISQMTLMIGGLFLALLFFFKDELVPTAIIIFSSSLLLHITQPLNNAVFTDLASRLGNERNHLFGMVNATGSIAFIIIPIILGIMSDRLGYYNTFSLMGLLTFFVATILLVTTPRKIRLPQSEIKEANP